MNHPPDRPQQQVMIIGLQVPPTVIPFQTLMWEHTTPKRVHSNLTVLTHISTIYHIKDIFLQSLLTFSQSYRYTMPSNVAPNYRID